jgi:hypothetical protein
MESGHMSRLILLPMLVMALFGSLLAAGSVALRVASDGVEWPSGQSVAYGEAVTLPDGAIFRFAGVVEDSRCPADATCIWQGRAVVALTIDDARFKVAYLGEDASIEAAGYMVTVHEVQPYPLASQPTDVEDYVVTVSVSKA